MSTITTIASGDLISTSRTTINTNLSNLNTDKMETSVLDTDTTLAANSDLKVASQKAVKTYIDTSGGANASETVRGIVEEATDAEVTAGTATGATGAKLFVTPAKLATRLTATALNPVVRTYLNAGSPATWTKPTGLKYVIVEVQAGGGAGAAGTAGYSGGGGGGGGYSRKLIAVATLGATETVTTGAAGASSSFGSHATATTGTAAVVRAPGVGGTGSSGDINSTGGDGAGGAGAAAGSGGAAGRTAGGSSVLGKNYGGGASGGSSTGDGDSGAGTAQAGIVIVTEYYI